MKKTIPAIIIILLIIGLGAYVYREKFSSGTDSVSTTTDRIFTSDKYGFSLIIPAEYTLLEGEKGGEKRAHYSYVMLKNEDASNPPKNGERAPTIDVDIFQNNLEELSLPTWFHTHGASNSKLTATQSYATTTLAGKEAISYHWSGLYEGETIAVEYKDNIIAFTVTYIGLDDKNIPAFKRVLGSVELK